MSDLTPDDIDPSRCPLCGGPNGCAMAPAAPPSAPGAAGCQSGGPCWCTRASFPPTLLALVPLQAKRKACICARCAAAHAQTLQAQPTSP